MKSLAILSFCGFFLFQLSSCKKDYTKIYSEKIEFNWLQIEPSCALSNCMTIQFTNEGKLKSNKDYFDGNSYSFTNETHININGRELEFEFRENDTKIYIKEFFESLVGAKNEDVLLQKQN